MTPREPKPPTTPALHVVGSEREPDRAPRGLAFVTCAPAEAARRFVELQAFVVAAMVKGIDFMIIPGTRDDRPSLLQPGAQKLAEWYGYTARFHVVEEAKDWSGGFFYFSSKVQLFTRAGGVFVGEGIGSANSRESKYAQRWVTLRDVPPALDVRTLRKETRPRWVTKKDVPSDVLLSTLRKETRPSRFDNGPSTYDVFQIPVDVFAIPNEDPYSLVNTLQKMAGKRAYVHAVISVTRSAGLFTQDVEDLPASAFGVIDEERPWEREPVAAAVPPPPPVDVRIPEPPPPPEPVIVDRDVKPANVVVPVPAPVATPKPLAKGKPAPEMSAKELGVVAKFGPLFAEAKTHERLRELHAEINRELGRGGASAAYLVWHGEQLRKARARLGPAPANAGARVSR